MLNYGTQSDMLGPLTAAQRSIWAAQQLRPEVPYNCAAFFAIDHDADAKRLTAACEAAAAHFGTPCARLSLADGEPIFIVDRSLLQADFLRCIDLRAESDPVAVARSWMDNDYRQPIDLVRDRLTNLTLLRITDNLSYFYLRTHHVLCDGYGANNFIRHIAASYSGSVPDAAEVDFSEFALIRDADRQYRQSSRSTADAEYWKTVVRGPFDATDLGGARRSVAPRHPLVRELACTHRLCENQSDRFDVARVVATIAVFIAKTTGRQDVSLSLPVSARTTTALKTSAGMVSNLVPLLISVGDGDTIGALTDQVTEALVGALRHQQFRRWPDLVADATRLDMNVEFGPVINILYFAAPFRFGPSETTYNLLTIFPIQDVAINIYPGLGEGTSRIQFAWNPDRYNADDIDRHISRLELLFERLLAADASVVVGEVLLLDGGERELVLSGWSGVGVGAPVGVVSQLLAAAVAADAGAVAVVDGGRVVSYRELDEWSTGLARVLIEVGVGPERAVGVAMDRCVELVVAWWAVVKAGGVYVPVDVAHPVERIAAVLDAVGAVCVLTCGVDDVAGAGGRPVLRVDGLDVSGRSVEAITDADRLAPLGADNSAYVIFTSGSTGVPKGVAVSHAGLLGVAAAQREVYGLGADARMLMVASPTFDASISEVLSAVGSGAALVVAPAQVYAGQALTALLQDQQVSAAMLTPTVASSLDRARLDGLDTLITAGEACLPELVTAWAPGRRMINNYGPTEATIWATSMPLLAGQPVGIGAPIPGVCALVLDARLNPTPVGVVGELYLGGPALARGYVGRAHLTAERFVANPYGGVGVPGTRMYRTGDLVRWTPAGTLECLGRADTQIKLRGQRIELGEIENTLLACPQISQAAATVHNSSTGGAQLIAYISGVPQSDPSVVRQRLGALLPEYMVPAQIVVLEEFPLTSSGKIDRKALPAPVFAAPPFRAPQTDTEKIVAEVFAEVLGLDQVGLDDDFFALGGDSLIATRVSARLQLVLGRQVPVRYLFDASTVGDLADYLHRHRGGPARPPLQVMPRPQRVPLSYAQQRLWFLNQFEGGAATYNMPTAFRVSGALDVEALGAALDDVIARHESLRTVFPDVDGVPLQEVLAARAGMWRGGGAAVVSLPEADVAGELVGLAGYRFDLSAEIPIRAQIYSVGPEEYVVGIVVHHIAFDGWSLAPMVRDVGEAYRARRQGRAPLWAPLAVQYADYTLWQRDWLGAESDPDSVIAGQLAYWRQELADLPEVVSLPTDRARPPVPSYRGDGVEMRIDPQVWAGVKAVAAAHNATVSMMLQAVMAVLLQRVGVGADIAMGAPIAGRLDPALDDLVGFFVNMWALRVGVNAAHRFSDVLAQVRHKALDAYGNQEVPFERLVEQLNPVRSAAYHPLFQVAMAFQNNARPEMLALDGVSVEQLSVLSRTAKFDLDFDLSEVPTEDPGAPMAAGVVTYATDLFDRSSIERLITWFGRVIEAVAADASVVVGEVLLLDGGERELVLSGWSGVGVGAPVGVVSQLLAAAVAADAGAVAVVDGGRVVSYRELDEWSTGLARVLIEVGVGPERAVGVAMDRCVELVVAWWAVVKAGGVYVPVDVAHPVERIAAVLDAVGAVCVLTCGVDDVAGAGGRPVLRVDGLDVSGRSVEAITDADRLAPLGADNSAYVIFTSGSTGVPKGVAVSHAGLLGVAAAQREVYGLGADARMLMVASPTFDASISEVLSAVGSGAALVVAPAQVYAGQALTALLQDQQVSAAMLTPTVASSLDRARLDGLDTLITAGEACLPELVTAWAPGRRMINNYGPTEATIWATSMPLLAGQPVGIGAPIPGVCALVLDARLNPTPVGVVGELYLGGPALARGYVGRAHLTAERFVANPYGGVGVPGTRMYRTGDLVRWTPAGTLECLGRADTQIKLRGQRIELGEIENTLLACPQISQAAATVHNSSTGGAQLIAYISGVPQSDPSVVRQRLGALLPEYMVPAQIVVLEEFPLTSSGKIDRKALPAPVFAAPPFRAPQTDTEKIVAEVFAEVLGLDQVGLDDDFFALGGDSLIATRVSARLQLVLGRQVPVRYLFDASTVGDLADYLHRHRGGPARPPLQVMPRPQRVPLSYAQQRLWFLNQFEGGAATYNMPTAFRVSGALDVEALGAALDDVIARHESLRTVFPDVDGVPLQEVLAARAGMWRGGGAAVVSLPEADVAGELVGLAGYRFDLSAEIPIRAQIYSVGPEEYVVGIVVHHIAFDGWSLAPMVRDVGEAYRARRQGRAPLWAPLAVQYADYTLWQRDWLGAESDPDSVIAGQLAYWRQELADLPEVVSLPTDRARPPVPSYRGDGVEMRIDPQVWAGVKAVAAAHNATVSMMLQAVMAVLLQRVGVGADIAMGAPIAGRLDPALDDLVGFFVNMWALRVGVNAAHRFSDVLAQVRHKALDAYGNQEVPFERLVEQLNPVRSAAYHPLFQVAMAFQNNARPEMLALDGVSVEQLSVLSRTAKFDLDFDLSEVPTEDPGAPMAAGVVTYATDLFDRSSIERLITWFGRVIEAVAADASVVVGEVLLLDGGERELVLSGWSGVGVGAPVGVVSQLLAAAVAADAGAVAVVDGGRVVSYRELDEWSTGLARVLIEVGVGPERAVGVAMDRCVELVVAWWAVVKAGGVYVPVDVAHPVERIAAVLDAVGAVCVLTCGVDDVAGAGGRPVLRVDGLDVSGRSVEAITDADRLAPLGADNSAYVIFTSGSTGVPKGVAVSHAGLLGVAAAQREVYGLGADARMLMVASPTFDASISEVLSAVGSGAALVVAPAQVYAGQALTALLQDQQVSAAMLTPTVASSLDRARLDGLDTLITAGEACLPELVTAWAPGRRMINNYGPTEATIWATSMPLLAGQPVGIGAPIPGVCALVLDARLNPTPVGVVGELYLGGPALARGYVGRAHLTAERFVANPYGGVGVPGTRMYRTGDLVRWTPAGTLECLGRADTQIKLRGQRIELGEIENTLLACPQISQAAATVHNSSTGGAQLIAYISGVPQSDPSVVRQRLGALLPEYMVPAQIVVLEEFPLTSSGKIDRKALPAPVFAAPPFRAPQTDTEKIVAEVFAEVLGLDQVGLDDDFFTLGGDSIVSLQLVSMYEARGVSISVRDVFECRTVDRLAEVAEVSVHARHVSEVHASDLTLDKFIDAQTLATAPMLPGPSARVRTVLLTGATGFLGRFLALEWLERLASVDGKLICLVRAETNEDARRRLDKTFGSGDSKLLAHYGELVAEHLEVIAGDKGETNLGLDQQTWQRLADTVDMIVDSAAVVSHVLPYSELFGPNVFGTAELIRLALTTKVKPYTYVSTMGVPLSAAPPVLEEDPDIRVVNPTRKIDDGLANGYNNSKWAGEVLLREANDLCGLPVAVFRCDMILTDTRYEGHLNLPDVFTRLMLSLAATGIAPYSFYELDADGKRQRAHFDALPVDFIAEAIATLGERVQTGVETYHVLNPYDDGIGLDEYVDWLIEAGYPIQRFPDYGEWVQRFESALRALPERQRQHSGLPLLPYLPDYDRPQMPLSGGLASAERFRAAVQEAKIGPDKDIPHVTPQVIVKYIKNLQLLRLV